MSQTNKKTRFLPFLHLLAMLTLAAWWAAYFWIHSPARDIFRLDRPMPEREFRDPGLVPRFRNIGSQSNRVGMAIRASLGDITCGATVLLLFGSASGVYVRRLDTWLGARTSGQAVAFRGQDLTAAALDANEEQQRGVLR